MANTFTTNLGLLQPGINDPASTNLWGGFLNNDLSLVDAAIAGYLTLSVTGSANVILTSVQGSPDQSRNQNFQFTGVLTGNITVFWPHNAARSFTVFNNTTGAFTLTVAVNNGSGVAAGATVAVPQLATMQLASDGTNIVSTYVVTPTANGVIGDSRNARMLVAAASATATFAADQLIMGTALNGSLYVTSTYSQAINLATTGAGGMDTGAAPASGYVNLYAIYNVNSAAVSIIAQNASGGSATVYSGANMPAGYTASALIGIWPTDGSSHFVAGILLGRDVSVPTVTVLTGGTATSYTSISITTAVPLAAKTVNGYFQASTLTGGTAPSAFIASYTGSVALNEQRIATTELAGTPLTALIDAPFYSLALFVAQTMYYKGASNVLVSVFVSGYSF